MVWKDSNQSRLWVRISRHLSKLVVGPVVLLHVVLSEPLDGLCVVHPLEGSLWRFEVLENTEIKTQHFQRRSNIKLVEPGSSVSYRVDVVEQLSSGRFENPVHHVTDQIL